MTLERLTMTSGRKFMRLQRQWYAKLKKKGFNDIEKDNNPQSLLSNKGNGYASVAKHPYNFEETQNFYRLASWFLHEYEFKSKKDQKIWELFCEGKTIRFISAEIKLSIHAVHKRLQKLLQGPFQDYRKMVFHDAN